MEEETMDNNKIEISDNIIIARTEIIVALACAVGTDISIVVEELARQLHDFNYEIHHIKISKTMLEKNEKVKTKNNKIRIEKLMNKGNVTRERFGTSILAQGVANAISEYRSKRTESDQGIAYIVDSLKHEDEVNKLKEIYTSAFFLFAINESEKDRDDYLKNVKNIGDNDANILIERDADENLPCGQHTKKVFQLADFHITYKGWRTNDSDNEEKEVSASSKERQKEYKKYYKKFKQPIIKNQMERILNLMYSNPYITPTFDEYAMFMAYSSSLRSADLSRQIGAVISNGFDIIATGANDVPAPTGGQYWPISTQIIYKYDINNEENINYGYDIQGGRDYTLGYDPNKHEIDIIIDNIIESFKYSKSGGKDSIDSYKEQLRMLLLKSPLKDITEFSRAVHAEMAAMLSCARTGTTLKDATLYSTTFPCHNCARHAVFAGIRRVVFIEPYLKSKAIELHKDTITIEDSKDKVKFEQFYGVGPRRFFDLFSMRLSTGHDVIRKSNDRIIPFTRKNARLRCTLPFSLYVQKELIEAKKYTNIDAQI